MHISLRHRAALPLAATAVAAILVSSPQALASTALTGSSLADATVMRAASSPAFTAENAPNPVAFRNSPNWGDASSRLPGFRTGQRMALICYEFGGPAGPYGNTLWYWAWDQSLGLVGGWVNDHYLNTPGTAAHPEPQTSSTCKQTSGSGEGQGDYSGRIFSAVNASGGIAWRNFPAWNYPASRNVGQGDLINLGCYMYGGAAGPYGNTLWYSAFDEKTDTYGWINDHYLSTPGTAASPQPQTWACYPAGSE